VRTRDSGNPQLTAEDICNFLVNFKPTVNFDNCPVGIWPSSDIIFNWTGVDDNTPAGGMEYSWKMDAEMWSAWSLGQMTASYTGLTNGPHTFDVRVRDMGNPQLTCETAPSSCDTCNFTIDTNCSFPPPLVNNFEATDGDETLNGREVELSWMLIPGCTDTYDIEKQVWDYPSDSWVWTPVFSVPHPATTYIDTDARYSGWDNPIQYRIRATNLSGTSLLWSTDSGYPPTRKIHMALWCVADDASGTNPSTPWSRGAADFADCNLFWNRFGLEFVLENSGDFFYIPNSAFKDLSGGEGGLMHAAYGQAFSPNSINVYFVVSSGGNTGRGYCMVFCPGTNHTTFNMYMVLCRDTRGLPPNENHIVLAHECGHGAARFWDQYLLDTNRNLILDDGTTCAADNTWCTGFPGPPMFCDDNSSYPENPGASGKIPKQLMWYSFQGHVTDEYDITPPQWQWTDDWIHGYEGNYPWP